MENSRLNCRLDFQSEVVRVATKFVPAKMPDFCVWRDTAVLRFPDKSRNDKSFSAHSYSRPTAQDVAAPYQLAVRAGRFVARDSGRRSVWSLRYMERPKRLAESLLPPVSVAQPFADVTVFAAIKRAHSHYCYSFNETSLR